MWTVLLPLLKSPYTWLIVAIVAILGYYNVVVWDLERTVGKQEINISKLEQKYGVCDSNFKSTIDTNNQNVKVIELCQEDISTLNGAYEEIVDDKDVLISTLRTTISNMKKPKVYPTEIIYKECKLKLKGVQDASEDDTTLIGISTIGK